jgi:hypothetical protein
VSLFLAVEIVNFLLVGISIAIVLSAVRNRKGTLIGATFVYLLCAISLVGVFRAFIFLAEVGVLHLGEGTVVLFWHVMFYLAIVMFLLGGRSFVRLAGPPRGAKEPFGEATRLGIVFVLASLFLALIAEPLNPLITAVFEGSIWDQSGLVHFVAFVLGGFVASYLFQLRARLGGNFAIIAVPLLAALAFLSFVHLWELLTESWRVIQLPSDTIELVEQLAALPTFLFFIYAFSRLRAVTEKSPA